MGFLIYSGMCTGRSLAKERYYGGGSEGGFSVMLIRLNRVC